jgi:tetratricopeptide (TPR) repeat protein
LAVTSIFARKSVAPAQRENVLSASGSKFFSGLSLRVNSEPSGASVLVNGRLAGCTPLCLEGLPTGSYGLRIERSGCKPLSRMVDLQHDLACVEKLDPVPMGSLTVNVKPYGAEVLLDGELVGNTPLKAEKIPAGAYEMLIRKTNFDSFSARVDVSPQDPLVFADFELKDKVLALMEGMIKSEPQRLTNYIDLGHYNFVNSRLDDSISVFMQGMEVMQTPLNFNGPGYSGRDHMSDDERALEERLRTEDKTRFLREIERHRSGFWPRPDLATFCTKLSQAQELMSRKNAGSWAWAESAANMALRSRNIDKAIEIYNNFIQAAPNSPDLPQAYGGLVEAYLKSKDVPKAKDVFEKAFKLCEKNGPALCLLGAAVSPYHERMSEKSRVIVLEMAERSLRVGLEQVKEPALRAKPLFDLGTVLTLAGKASEAVPLLEQGVKATADPTEQEDRTLLLANGLRAAGQLDRAYEIYTKLLNSARTTVRELAKTGRINVEADRARLKLKK